jgi:hypothetical protein
MENHFFITYLNKYFGVFFRDALFWWNTKTCIFLPFLSVFAPKNSQKYMFPTKNCYQIMLGSIQAWSPPTKRKCGGGVTPQKMFEIFSLRLPCSPYATPHGQRMHFAWTNRGHYICHAAHLQRHTGRTWTTLGPTN